MGEFDKTMAKAFRLAAKGRGYTSPNPPVGAIIVKDGQIIGQGYHRKAGLPHAEIEALQSVHSNVSRATMVVTLEPCSHYGKTPPCVETIMQAGIVKVVSAISDPNPLVAGKGYQYLRNAGIEVIDGVLANYATAFYQPYFKYITTGLPYVTLKYAQTIDGRIATSTGHSQWISSPQSLKFAHKLRAINDAVIIGSGTLRLDDPKLTTRLVKGTNPIRIVLSESGLIPMDKSVFIDGQASTYLATSLDTTRNSGTGFEVIPIGKGDDGLDLKELLAKLGKMGVMTVMVEGGSAVLTSFLKQQLADKIVICIAPLIIGKGIEAIAELGIKKLDAAIELEGVELIKSGPDFIISGIPVWK
jgi:diaminohydroxyphosphoribosylaminopyrimidine deaminase / 5-amino-6-(5-phosphoribosylamino)uracil reductase